jgi:hypothetical protein
MAERKQHLRDERVRIKKAQESKEKRFNPGMSVIDEFVGSILDTEFEIDSEMMDNMSDSSNTDKIRKAKLQLDELVRRNRLDELRQL